MTDDDNGGKSLIVDPPDGKVPYQPWASAVQKENRGKYVEPNVPCFPSGVPRSMYVPTQIEILQTPVSVLILFERAHTYRIIPTDVAPARGRKHRDSGWETHAAAGKAIRSSWTSRITMRRRGSTRRVTSTHPRRT